MADGHGADAGGGVVGRFMVDPLPEELEACRRAGMNECLTKPVSLKMLQRALGQVIHSNAMLEAG